jgi:two-component system, OmpR family, phosphate regulon sensor histidine kinase PhoR
VPVKPLRGNIFVSMQKRIRFIVICIVVTFIIAFTLQALWLRNYYKASVNQFGVIASNELKAALQEEKSIRTEKIATVFRNLITDTTRVKIYTVYNAKEENFMFYVENKSNPKDKFNLAFRKRKVFDSTQKLTRAEIANRLTGSLKEMYKESGTIFYYTKVIGDTLVNMSERMKSVLIHQVDSIYKIKMAAHGVSARYVIASLADTSGTKDFSKSQVIKQPAPYQTQLYETDYFDADSKQFFIYATFNKPGAYLFNTLKWLLLGSVLLIAVTGISFYLMYKLIMRQKQLAQIKDDFIGNMTHELKTPIATIGAAIEGMQNFGVLDNKEKTAAYLAVSATELNRLTQLVNNVLHISIYEKQQANIHKEKFNVAEMVESTLHNFSMKNGDEVVFDFQNELAQPIIETDPLHLQNVLNNLVDNAVKYAQPGEQTHITIYCKNEAGRLVLSVEDNGPGIATADQQRIFDKFYRVPQGTRHDVKGSGLGLFYVKIIIEQLGGSINVASTLQKGSRFTLQLPALAHE